MATKGFHGVQWDGMTFGMAVDTSTTAWKKFKTSIKYEPCVGIFGTEVYVLTVPYLKLASIMETAHWLVSERRNFDKFHIDGFENDEDIFVKYTDEQIDFRNRKGQFQMTNAEIKAEITKALENLGYMKGVVFTGFYRSFNRYEIFVNYERVGIYDIDRHTFVD